jgi:hypothetical protein
MRWLTAAATRPAACFRLAGWGGSSGAPLPAASSPPLLLSLQAPCKPKVAMWEECRSKTYQLLPCHKHQPMRGGPSDEPFWRSPHATLYKSTNCERRQALQLVVACHHPNAALPRALFSPQCSARIPCYLTRQSTISMAVSLPGAYFIAEPVLAARLRRSLLLATQPPALVLKPAPVSHKIQQHLQQPGKPKQPVGFTTSGGTAAGSLTSTWQLIN